MSAIPRYRPARRRSIAGAIVAAVAVLAGGLAYNLIPRRACFQYDLAAEAYTVCGTQEEIKRQMRDLARPFAEDAGAGICTTRAHVQAAMHGWPDEYREAYTDGCWKYSRER